MPESLSVKAEGVTSSEGRTSSQKPVLSYSITFPEEWGLSNLDLKFEALKDLSVNFKFFFFYFILEKLILIYDPDIGYILVSVI